LWSEEYYQAIARAIEAWDKQNKTLLKVLNRSAVTYQRAYSQIIENLDKTVMKFNLAQDRIRALAVSVRPIESRLARKIREANFQMGAALSALRPYEQFVKRLKKEHFKWLTSLETSIGVSPCLIDIGFMLSKDISLISKSALLTQRTVARLDFEALGAATKASKEISSVVGQRIVDMAESYSQMWERFKTNPYVLFDVPRAVFKIPPLEVYLAVHEAEISTGEEIISSEEKKFLAEVKPSQKAICEALKSLDERLVQLYEGAKEAIYSNNVDKVRHATTSLRELFTQVLHKLAPDDAFFRWNQDSSNIYRGRPTRKGRLLYICRGINYGPVAKFVEKDVSAALAFHELLEKGVHSVEASYGEEQLRALLVRMECLLLFLIKIAKV
jgi:uncharacterized protein YukE